MPREFDSQDQQVSGSVMTFSEQVTCVECGQDFDGVFSDDSMSVQDMTDPPTGVQVCPVCSHTWLATMTGWSLFSEAG